MGPPRSVVMRSTINNLGRSMMRPPMGSNYRPLGMGSLGSTVGLHRRGTTTRGRISHYRSDGRRGMLNTRMISTHHRRLDMRPPMSLHNRRYPSIRGRGDGRSRLSIGMKRTYDTTKVSRGVLIKRALQAAKDLDDDALSDNDDEEEDEDDEDDDAGEEDEPTPKKVKKATAAASDEEEDPDDKDATASSQADSGESTKKKDDKDADTTVSTIADGDDSASTKKTLVKKKIVASGGGGEKTAAEDRKSSAADAEEAEKRQSRKITTKYRTSTFIKLNCVHCSINCVTFKEYQIHLYSRQHKLKMREVYENCNARVLEMRAAQRNAQKDEDQKSEDGDGEGKTARASFCVVCKLNYRQPRATHQQSDAHKQMKKYLMPFCTVCKISCRSPIAYENHRVSLDHLKNKARVERYSSKVNEDTDDDTQVDLGELVNLGNLTTVDEVGKVDEIGEVTGGTTESSASGAKKRREIRADSDDDDDDEDDDDDNGDELQMIIGEEHVKKVEVQYCELCNIYLPRRMDSQEKVLRDHCKKRSHLKLYIRYRNDKKLREKAERIHKKKLKGDKEAANAKKDDEKTNAETNEGGTKSAAAATKSSTGGSTSATATASSDKKSETTGGDSGASKDTSTGKGNAEGSQGTTGTAEGGKNAGSTGGAVNDTAANTSQAEDEIWQVVDNDELGDLLRGVAEVDEEDDDKEAMLERYDKFRHTEKNGIESASAAAGASGSDAGDSATSKAVGGATATNGGGSTIDTSTNGDSSSNKETGKAEG
ncbi:hypothetical protein AND_003302 [Anopheles darlingi]|uniref:U1-type domain-containing protein n=2 Tax=Anopheles darlingi TaxID=43151 RepID=W5JNQ7_ANODA|nr:hypothetical protein AND_003302 [Anopheles darlingi]